MAGRSSSSTSSHDGGGSRRGTTSRSTAAPARPSRRGRGHDGDAEAPASSGRGSLGGLLRGPGSVLGGLSGIDGATRSLDRLSRAAERGADFLERLEEELGWERAIDFVERLETLVALIEGRGVLADRLRHLVHAVEGIHHSMEEIETMVADLHEHVVPPAPKRSRAASGTSAARPARSRR